MANSYLPETLRGAAASSRLQIATLIGDLRRSVAALTADIEHEEIRSGVRNVTNPTYPVLARSLSATIASLGRRRELEFRMGQKIGPRQKPAG